MRSTFEYYMSNILIAVYSRSDYNNGLEDIADLLLREKKTSQMC